MTLHNNGDFIFDDEAEKKAPTVKRSLGTPADRAANDGAVSAASAAYRIRSTEPDPAKWKAMIEACPEEIRPLVRTYLEQAWRSQQQRRRRETEGKRTAIGDIAMQQLAALTRRL